jgi:predicted dehydrogenase
MLKGGVFGFGGVGQGMTRQININKWHGEDTRIVAVCNRGKAKRDLAEQQYGLAAYESVDDLIAHGLDFMLIVSNTASHYEAAVKCAEAGIPYLIEKPITLTLEHAEDLVAKTEKAGLINGVNYSMRYRPHYLKMKQMAESGELGDILSVWARTFRGHGFYTTGHRHRAIVEPEESGGWLVHHMCHIVDFAIWIAGEVDEVYCLTQTTAPPEMDSEEIIVSTVKFKNGAIGTLFDQIGSLRDHSAGVFGTKGGLSEMLDGVKPLLKLDWETDIEFRPPHVIDPTADIKVEDGLAHFIRCLKEGRQTNVPVSEACYSLKVCFAMKESAKTGKPVKV